MHELFGHDPRVLPQDLRTIAKRLHLLDRQGEWWSAVFMIACALTLMIPGDVFKYQAWSAVENFGITKAMCTGAFSAVGFGRAVALIVNGYLQLVTPAVRWVAALAGFFIWAITDWLLVQGTPEHDHIVNLYVPFVTVLAVKELVNIYLAAADVRIQP